MHELGNALDEGKGKDKGRTKARLGQMVFIPVALLGGVCIWLCIHARHAMNSSALL